MLHRKQDLQVKNKLNRITSFPFLFLSGVSMVRQTHSGGGDFRAGQ